MISFSIITVVRNDYNGLIKTQNSLINQTYGKYEWIIIDGNSTDGTKEYVLSLKYPYLKSISEKDKGIYDAMNKGITLASNDYILFLNAGDIFFDSNTLNNVQEKLSLNPVDVIFGGAEMYFRKHIKYYRPSQNLSKSIFKGLPGHHQATYYKTKLLHYYPYDLTYIHSGDYAIIAKLYTIGISSDLIDLPLTKFEVGHNSYKNIFKVLIASTKIQSKILKMNTIHCIVSFLKRFTSSIIVIVIFRFPFILKVTTKS
jgi:putative colanic acid biosynthesis glycosyltransferase